MMDENIEKILRNIFKRMLKEDPELLIQICIEANQMMEKMQSLLKDYGINFKEIEK